MSLLGSRPRRWNGATGIVVLLSLAGLAAASPGWSAPERSTAAAEVALTHGILAFEEGDFARALELFEEAVRWDDRNGTALHWLGLTHLKLCHAAEAVKRLRESLFAKLPPEAGRTRVWADLEVARELKQREGAACAQASRIEAPDLEPLSKIPGLRPWSALIGLEMGEDSNPGLLPREFLGIPVVSAGPAEATADQALRLDLRLDLHPLKPRGSWTPGASFAGSQAVYRDLDDFDLSLVQATVSAVRGGDPRGSVPGPLGPVWVPSRPSRAAFALQGGGTYVLLGGEEYVSLAEGAASLLLKQATRFDLVVLERSFAKDGSGDLQRSGGEAFVSVSQSFALGQAGRDLRVGVLAGRREGGRAFESSFRESFAEVSLPLAPPWDLVLQGAYREERYDHPESRLGVRNGSDRRDDSWRLNASLVWKSSERLRWTARASWLDNDSSLEPSVGFPLFDYRRTMLALGTIWRL